MVKVAGFPPSWCIMVENYPVTEIIFTKSSHRFKDITWVSLVYEGEEITWVSPQGVYDGKDCWVSPQLVYNGKEVAWVSPQKV